MSKLSPYQIQAISGQVIGNSEMNLMCSNSLGSLYYANLNACNRLGFSLEEIQQKTVSDIAPLLDLSAYEDHCSRVFKNGSDRLYNYHKDCKGTVYPVEIYSIPYADEKDGQRLICSLIQDAQNSQRYQRMLETVENSQRIGSFDFNLTDQSILASDNLLAIMGTENAEKLRPASVVERLNPEDTGRWNSNMVGFINGHHRTDEQFMMETAGGNISLVRVVMWSTLAEGKVAGITGYYEVLDEPKAESFISLNESQRRHIIRALNYTSGRVTGPNGAGKLLGINGKTLFARMKKLGINRDDYVRRK